jgi:predicted XRE-type DNA-binding protein
MNRKEAEDLKLKANILISLRRKMRQLKLSHFSVSEALKISIDEVQ